MCVSMCERVCVCNRKITCECKKGGKRRGCVWFHEFLLGRGGGGAKVFLIHYKITGFFGGKMTMA